MPTMECVFVDSTKVLNWLTLIKGGYGTNIVTTVPPPTPVTATLGGTAYANADAYPNCQSYTIQNKPNGNTGGLIFKSEGDPNPVTSGIALTTGDSESDEAQQNSLPLVSFFIGTDTNNTKFILKWNYT